MILSPKASTVAAISTAGEMKIGILEGGEVIKSQTSTSELF